MELNSPILVDDLIIVDGNIHTVVDYLGKVAVDGSFGCTKIVRNGELLLEDIAAALAEPVEGYVERIEQLKIEA